MGLRMYRGANSVPAKIQNGIVYYYVGDVEYQYEVPGLVGWDFPLQCNSFTDRRYHAYLTNGDISVLLRFDKTGTLYFTKTKILIKHFSYIAYVELPDRLDGGFLVGSINTCLNTYVVDSGRKLLISGESYPFTAISNTVECSDYMRALRMQTSRYWPMLMRVGNKLFIVDSNYRVMGEVPTVYLKYNTGCVLI